MGKRKSSKPPPKKQRPKLDVAFNCPFCNSNKSVSAIMDWDSEVSVPCVTSFLDVLLAQNACHTGSSWGMSDS